jgi:amino acid transporter
MLRWAWMLGGLIVWFVHFMGVYGIASLGDVVSEADDPLWRMIGLGFSGVCVLAAVALAVAALRRVRRTTEPADDFRNQLALLGGGVAALAIVWQALPTLIGH